MWTFIRRIFSITVADVFSLKECAILLRLRGDAMQQAVPLNQGAMAAFIGADIETTEKIIQEVKSIGVCNIGNDNADGQVVISGDKLAVDKAIELSKDFGVKRAVKLPVSAPFHCQLMQPAQLIMEKALNELNFNYPTVPIISNISNYLRYSKLKLKQNLIDQVTGTVRWRETMNLANKLGVNTIIELGNGKVLSGIAKRMIDNVRAINVEKPSDFDEIIKKI